MKLLYLAHPVAPRDGETIESNLASAESWLSSLQAANPDAAIICPWLTWIRVCHDDDNDILARERGLLRCERAARPCDGILLCGPRISLGMRREALQLRWGSEVHRFRSREQDRVLPADLRPGSDYAEAPHPLRHFQIGATPLGASALIAEW